MSASPFKEMSAKTSSGNRDVTKKEPAGNENNFDQVLGQKAVSQSAKKPQSLSPEKKSSDDDSSQVALEEPTTLEINKTVAKGDSKKDSKGTDKGKKEETIKKFMDSFESEFQVPPTRLVAAISLLTPEQLGDSAEQTAESVIGQLNLDPELETKAKKQYLDLIQDLNQISVANQQPAFVPELGMMSAGLTQERFQKGRTQRDALQKSIDQMNQSFWQPKGFSQAPLENNISKLARLDSEVPLSKISNYQEMANQNSFEGLNAQDFLQRLDNSELQKYSELGLDPELNRQLSTEEQVMLKNKLLSNDVNQAAKDSDAELMLALGLAPGLNESQSQQAQTANLDSSFQAKNKMPDLNGMPPIPNPGLESKLSLSSKGDGQSGNAFSGESSQAKVLSKNSKEAKSKGDDLKTLFAAQLGSELSTGEIQKGDAVTTAVPLKDLTQTEVDKNIQNVMNQAQYLVKKGGGEVKVKMTPEGLGMIELKVELIDGKVQMQMLTENKETKKILESNMSDLKDHLSSHKLSVESIKIDSVQGVSTDVATRNQSSSDKLSQNQNQSDRQTKQFWNQFQNQFGQGSQREALFESPKIKGYAQKKANTIGPAESVSSTNSSSTSGKGSGLNLVA